MRHKFEKIYSVIKKDGFLNTIKKITKYLKAEYGFKYNVFSLLYYKLNKKKYEQIINEVLNGNFKRVIIWKSDFGWNVPLFQRPQHIATNLAKNNSLVLYEVTTMTDKVKDIKKISSNLYLINLKNPIIRNIIECKMKSCKKEKYIQFYSTDYKITVDELKDYIKNDYKIIYEYIDDMSPQIVGTTSLPKNMIDKYNYMIEDKENVFVVVTADRLEEDIVNKRGNEKLAFASNGVDYNHFQNIEPKFEFDEKFNKILNNGKKIIGYYGALACWMDYELIKYLAEKRPEYDIVFFGVKYDDSFDRSKLDRYENVHFLGKRNYKDLPNYASRFDVCTIPFKVNEITKATSPVKLFEYMALGKPIVTTEMDECKKYKSVAIAKNKEEFVELVDNAVKLEDDLNYKEILKEEALDNTWEKKAQIIINLLEKCEQ